MMGKHITRYRTENGKTRRVKDAAAKPAGKDGAAGKSGAGNKNTSQENSARQGA
jgi:hypothetical protein